jgi:hypothetical protein
MRVASLQHGGCVERGEFGGRPPPHRIAHAEALPKHDPEKWKPVLPRDKRESACAEIMLKQRDEIMMRFHLIAS